MDNVKVASELVRLAQSLTATAASQYESRRREVDKLIKTLQTGLDKHEKKFAKDPDNWGYAGDLGRVEELLKEAVDFISGSER